MANRPIYAAIGVSLEGDKDILGLWAGAGGEGAKFWMAVLTALRNRGGRDTFFVVCERGSYYQAARLLGLSGITPVRRRIETLQRELGDLTLVVSDGTGIEITKIGEALLELIRSEF